MTHTAMPAGAFDLVPRLPGDKSITHRAYLSALLAPGSGAVIGGNDGEDCARTLQAVTTLGATAQKGKDGIDLFGPDSMANRGGCELDLGNSGTGLRLLMGLLAGRPGSYTLTGDASLRSRPMERVAEPLRAMGARIETTDGGAPVRVTGAALRGTTALLPVPSAQIKSALLLAGSQAEGETRITGAGESRDHTERLLRAMGAAIEGAGDTLTIRGGVALRRRDVLVPADPSAAAFYAAAAALVPGSRVRLEGVSANPGRTAFRDTLEAMGARIERRSVEGDVEPRETLAVSCGQLNGIEVHPDRIAGLIDELPILAVAAAFADGTTVVRGASELRHKESDRLALVAEGLRAIGARVDLLEDGWRIEGSAGHELPGGTVTTHGDHRVGMAFLIAGLRCSGGVRLADDPRIATSDPHFLSNFYEMADPL